MATQTEGRYAGEFLLYEEPLMSRDEVTLAAGSSGEVLAAGTVLGKITTGGKYTAYDDGLTNGAQTAVAVLLSPVDITADVTAVVIARLAAVKTAALQWHADADATAKTAAYTALALKNIIVR